ncbi:hypothetical protein [Azospirillum largimobile]
MLTTLILTCKNFRLGRCDAPGWRPCPSLVPSASPRRGERASLTNLIHCRIQAFGAAGCLCPAWLER